MGTSGDMGADGVLFEPQLFKRNTPPSGLLASLPGRPDTQMRLRPVMEERDLTACDTQPSRDWAGMRVGPWRRPQPHGSGTACSSWTCRAVTPSGRGGPAPTHMVYGRAPSTTLVLKETCGFFSRRK